MQKFDIYVMKKDDKGVYVEVNDPNNKDNHDCLTYHIYIPIEVFKKNNIKPKGLMCMIINNFQESPFVTGFLNKNLDFDKIKIKKGEK